MKSKLAVVGLLLLFVAVVSVVTLWRSGPDASQFADLKEPRLTELNAQNMLAVRADGDPNVVAGKAFSQLFSTYYRLEGVTRIGKPPAPRARWQFAVDTPRHQWRGAYALPIPAHVKTLPSVPTPEGMRVGIEQWEYGPVAEILHVGKYSDEQADIERLLTFVDSHGYRAIGEHEEEYVKGPGMFLAGNPEKYLTIIRVRVTKADDEEIN